MSFFVFNVQYINTALNVTRLVLKKWSTYFYRFSYSEAEKLCELQLIFDKILNMTGKSTTWILQLFTNRLHSSDNYMHSKDNWNSAM